MNSWEKRRQSKFCASMNPCANSNRNDLRKLRADRSRMTMSPASYRRCERRREGTENLMPHIYAAVKAYATLGEICDALREVFGTHEESVVT